MNFLGKNF
jgi:hypothetical protein